MFNNFYFHDSFLNGQKHVEKPKNELKDLYPTHLKQRCLYVRNIAEYTLNSISECEYDVLHRR